MAHALVVGTGIGTGDGVVVGEKVGVGVNVDIDINVDVDGEVKGSDDAGAGVVVDDGAVSPVVEDMDDDVGAVVAEGMDNGAEADVVVEAVAHELARANVPSVALPTNSAASFRNSLRENPFSSSGSFSRGTTR